MDTPPNETPDPCPGAELTVEDRDLLAYLSGNPGWRREPQPPTDPTPPEDRR